MTLYELGPVGVWWATRPAYLAVGITLVRRFTFSLSWSW